MKELYLLVGALLLLSSAPHVPHIAIEAAPVLLQELSPGIPLTTSQRKGEVEKELLLSENAFTPELFIEFYRLNHISPSYSALSFINVHIRNFRSNSPPASHC